MRKLIPFLLVLMIGCGSDDVTVPFNTKTNISYTDGGYEYKMSVLASTISWGIEIDIENLGIEPIVLDAECAIFLDEKGNEIKAANTFYTRTPGFRSLSDERNFQIKSGEKNSAGFVPPANAVKLAFKNFDRNRILFKLSLKP